VGEGRFVAVGTGTLTMEEIVFTKWEAGDWDGQHRYAHSLVGWTRLEKLKVNGFAIDKRGLFIYPITD
jgi:hypothetical protein